MLFWIVITAVVFALVIAIESYLRAKRSREKKLKAISERIQQLEEKDAGEKSDEEE